jgi:imidazolonepropionase-like amidohydrolase
MMTFCEVVWMRGLLLSLVCAGALAQAPSPTVSAYLKVNSPRVMLRHVRIIDGTGAPAVADQDILLAAGKIAAITPSSAHAAVSADTPEVELAGHTVFPGIVGMHDHLYYIARPNADSDRRDAQPPLMVPQMTFSSPRMYLAAGVTTILTTGSVEPYTDLNLKQQIDANQLPGPHIDVTGPYLEGKGSPFIQMHQLTGPEDAKAMVDYWAGEGVTSFKAYMYITRAELKAAIDEAHSKGIKVTGHLCSVTYPEAVELGIDNLEHGFFVDTMLDPGKEPDACPRTTGGPTLAAMDPDGPEAKKLIALLVAHHVAITSTQPVFESQEGPPPMRQLIYDTMSAPTREAYLYTRAAQSARAAQDPAAAARQLESFHHAQQLERRFVAAGGLLTAGLDPTGDGHVLPGFGDQREIELLVQSGFTPVEAIKIATLNGAIYERRDQQIGSIAVGKNADLVVVKGDPSTHIEDIENVEIVFKDGLGFDSVKLFDSVRGRYGQY